MKNLLFIGLCIAMLGLFAQACSNDTTALAPTGFSQTRGFALADANGNPLTNVFWAATGTGFGPTLGFSGSSSLLGFVGANGESCTDPDPETPQTSNGNADQDGCTDSTGGLSILCTPGGTFSLYVDDGSGARAMETVTCEGSPEIVFTNIGEPTIVMYLLSARNGNLDGRVGADNMCAKEAPSNVSKSNTRAFISVGKADTIFDMPTNYNIPIDQVVASPNGTTLGSTFADLLDNDIMSSLSNAGLTTSTDTWWSGSSNNGLASGFSCSNWTDSGSSSSLGFIPILTGQTGWTVSATNWISNTDLDCSTSNHVVCIAFD